MFYLNIWYIGNIYLSIYASVWNIDEIMIVIFVIEARSWDIDKDGNNTNWRRA